VRAEQAGPVRRRFGTVPQGPAQASGGPEGGFYLGEFGA